MPDSARGVLPARSTPGAAVVANYGMLKLNPLWEPLRGDPRFEKFVIAKAPKESMP